ncbi:MAG: extracellular solute-binding protein [Rhodospirillales bacterium]|nr:extracellular solute-binding protein [Rhodospirillales bacterium]
MTQLTRRAALAVGASALALPAVASAQSAGQIAAAKKDGRLNVIALPPDWANYGEIISTFEKKYGIKVNSAAPDDSSAQELQAIRSLKGQTRGPDTVDVGPTFAISGVKEGLWQPYKVATWASIPANMKEASGLWYGDYFGIISLGVNRSVVKNPPKTWADLLKPEYKGMVALNGSPSGAAAAFSGVYAAALGNGGSLDNIEPGIEFFGKLAKAGNFNPASATPASLQSGTTPIVLNWDYLNLAQAKKSVGKVQIDTILPEGAQPLGAFYCQAISKYAPNPASAKLWMEFLYSDEGQLLFLKGFAHPARFADLAKRNAIPAALAKTLPPAAPYAAAAFPTAAQQDKAKNVIAANWSKMVKV